MRRLVPFIVILLVTSSALAAPGDISRKLQLPINNPTGVAWDGKYLWIADRKTDLFYKLDPENGEIAGTIESPGYFPSGLAWDGDLLWSTDPADGRIYATDVKKSMTVRTLEAPGPSPTGIAWDGAYLWICDNRLDKILKIDSGDGTTIISFPSPAVDPRGITFDGTYLWCSDRIRDCIYMIDPKIGHVVMILDAPGPFTWGLAWNGDHLINTDYQHDTVYTIVVKDGEFYRTSKKRRALVDFTTAGVVTGTGQASTLDIYYAIPSGRPSQKLISDVRFTPEPTDRKKDQWDQSIAVFHYEDLEPADKFEVSMQVEIESFAIRYFIYPDEVGTEIPKKIKQLYLADGSKYDINNSYIQKLVTQVVGEETNLYWKARKLFQYLIANMEYKLAGGWNTAPTVLKRGNGSCSEYSFSYIALCRAAGVPARYVGSLVVRGDDASYDDVFHRWCEIYLPNYGWVPVDANAGDKKLPADQGSAFGGISNRFLITTESGGDSSYLGWGYNYDTKWTTTGKCRIMIESTAEWEPLDDDS
ncbi:MAG: transglutaminase [bacterium]|nr:MAG: transglutaminase [bacterium]